MAPTSHISVVMCTYNRCEMLRDAIQDMAMQNTDDLFSYEIVVVDDDSTDDTPQIVRQAAREAAIPIRYVREGGAGYTHAMNRGLREATGNWIAFFDDDQRAGAEWLKKLLLAALKNGADVVGGSRMLELPKNVTSVLGPVCRAVCGEFPYSKGRGHKNPLPGGGFMLVNRRVFEGTGPFDEEFLVGGCDRDIVVRAIDASFVVQLAPEAVVFHRISPDRLKPDRIKRYSLQVGCSFAYIDWKRLGPWKTFFILGARMSQTVLAHIPILLMSVLTNRKAEVLDRKSLLWKTEGYGRKTFALISPRLLAQKVFFHSLEFRKQR